MNRAERRRRDRGKSTFTERVRALERRVEATGRPGRIHGLIDACSDCHADGEIVVLPGKRAVGHVYHSDGCPAATGVVPWRPVPTN